MNWRTEDIPAPASGQHGEITGARCGRANSVEDMLTYIETTPRIDGAGKSSEKAYNAGGEIPGWDIVEAKDVKAGEMVAFYSELARTGYARAREDLRDVMVEVQAGANDAPRPDFFYDVAGSIPSVPAYVSGDPANMMDLGETPIKPTCRISVEVGVCWQAKAKAIYMRGVAILGLINSLERQGINTELSIAYTCNMGERGKAFSLGPSIAIVCPIRELGQAFDLDQIAFFLATPGPLRRLGFALMERDKETAQLTRCGYGEGASSGLALPDFDMVFPRILPHEKEKWEDAKFAHDEIAKVAGDKGYSTR